jgi:hypothetical protein
MSERIFYNDDDDLLLSHHVETLGAALDDADIVDTPAISLHGGGGLSLGMHDTGWPVMREMLVERKFKSIFDTHLAHRRSSYLRGSGAWLGVKIGGVAAHFLQVMAADAENKWRTNFRMTALSLHGAHRIMMSASERADELRRVWSEFGGDGAEDKVRQAATCAFHSLRLFGSLKARGIDVDDAILDDARKLPLTSRQLVTMEAARSLAIGARPPEADAIAALDELLDASLGSEWPTECVTRNYYSLFGPDAVERMLDQCRPRLAVELARLHLALCRGAPAPPPERILQRTPPWQRFFVGVSILSGLVRAKDDRAWGLQENLSAQAPQSIQALSYWNLRATLAEDRGEVKIAHHAKATAAEIRQLPY